MKEKRLLNALGQVDEKYIEEAALNRHTSKSGWLRWGAVAACLCLIAWAAFVIPGMLPSVHGNNHHLDAGTLDGDPNGYRASGDIAPMVCVNRVLYQIAGSQPDLSGKEDEFFYLGEISSKVSSSQKPTEDFQANDDIIGSKIYQYDGENVVVEINGQYWLYEVVCEYLE